MDRTRVSGPPGPVTPTVIITVSNRTATTTSSGELDRAAAPDAEDASRQQGAAAAADGDGDESVDEDGPVQGVGFTNLADLARRSLRARAVRRRLALHRLRRRYHQQQVKMCALAISRQMQLLRRDKEILTNFVRLRLYETQSSFSGSDVASSSGMDRSSDSERQGECQGEGLGADMAADDGRGGRAPRQAHEAASGPPGSGADGGSGAEDAAEGSQSRKDDEIRKILRLRRRRRRLLLESCAPAHGQAVERVEQYTDTTRNAAVLMGERDIKQSLRMQRRSLAAARGLSLPASAQPGSLTALARAHRRAGNPRAALVLLEQALLLDPLSQRALIERSQCYQTLGQPRLALLDAEDALDLNKKSDTALYQKAQALYAMGHFEKALVVYHRCRRLRPENPDFKAGIRKATEAIMNTIACLPRDFHLSSLEGLLSSWPDEERESSVGSTRPAAPGLGTGPGHSPGLTSDPSLDRAGTRGGGSPESEDQVHVTALRVYGVPSPGSSSTYDESDDPPSAGSGGASGLEMCKTCNTVHHLGQDRPVTTPPSGDVEEEARKIALILSLTSTFDHRNKHLRDKLFLPSTGSVTPVSAIAAPVSTAATTPISDGRLARSFGPRGRNVLERCLGGQRAAEPQVPEHWLVRTSPRKRQRGGSTRPGMERVPPSLGSDIQFLEQIALDPGLRGLPVSGMAEEGVRYLKARQVFWYRRGPINPEVSLSGETCASSTARPQNNRIRSRGAEKL